MAIRDASGRIRETLLLPLNESKAPEPDYIDVAPTHESLLLDECYYICPKQLATYLLRLLNGEDELEAALETISATSPPLLIIS